MARVLGVVRTTVFLGWLAVTLATTTIAVGVWAVQMATTITAMSAQAAATALAHRKQLAQAVARTKAKARLRRAVVAVPLVGGAGAMAWFEEQDYREWQTQNPGGTRADYACEVAALTAEVLDEMLQDMPEGWAPSPDLLASLIPECDTPVTE